MEKILLDQLNGQRPTAFRFIQNSDELYEGDGFTVDNFMLMGISKVHLEIFSQMVVSICDILGLADFILDSDDASNYVSTFCDMNLMDKLIYLIYYFGKLSYRDLNENNCISFRINSLCTNPNGSSTRKRQEGYRVWVYFDEKIKEN